MGKITRRQFVRNSMASTALFAVSGTRAFASSAPKGWELKRAVNPNIDNLRVVSAINSQMIRKDPGSWEMEEQNSVINTEEVDRTMDAMAASLAMKADAHEAWRTIFQKPDNKEWKQVTAAIKVNCNSKNNARIGVVAKVCKELNSLGIPFENIIIYDGRSNAYGKYAKFAGNGLPQGVIVSDGNKALGGTGKVLLPWERTKKYRCTKAMINGKVDILVNIANNKGCDKDFGNTTLILKNHAGTFEPMPLHFGGGIDYLMAFNRSEQIMGTVTARQQLCIVDSLWAMRKGPFGVPEERLNCLVMGTFGPVVDYLTATKIREPLLGVTHTYMSRFLTDFGYQENAVSDLVMVKV